MLSRATVILELVPYVSILGDERQLVLNFFMLHVPCLIPHDCWQGVALGELCLLGHI